jgi:hypothetical protein
VSPQSTELAPPPIENCMEISYLTNDPSKAYSKAIRAAENKEALLEVVTQYKEAADDAVQAVEKMTDADFVQFKKDVPKMNQEDLPIENLEELVNKWGDIVMPRKMTTATLISLHFHVPWGAAFKRLEESGWKV